MINYYELGPDKPLNETVFVGSHDAGVTGGEANTQTQDRDIYGQAESGVRLFDIRIIGAVVKQGSAAKVVDLKAYHGIGPESKKSGVSLRTGGDVSVTVKSMWGGAFGMSLTRILSDASKFVIQNPTEFLILKFDHCSNWLGIAEACVAVLGNTIYKGGGNLNTKTLRDLQGKVIVLFTEDGLKAVHHLYGIPQGILGIKNLQKGGAYNPKYHGLQYFGKGGTSIWKPFKKIEQNVENQKKLMTKGAAGNPNVMGMMYWTTTGMNESIKERNATMWSPPNVKRLKQMWEAGLQDAIEARNNTFRRIDGFDSATKLKAFMPNFVMIDFADPTKCDAIFELNTHSPTFLVKNIQNFRL
jgi:hypothetical protein